MEVKNQTWSSDFVILGFPNLHGLRHLFIFIFLLIYCFALLGNMVICVVVFFDSHLHIPMYFFLSNLSVLDICYTSVTVPKLLHIFWSDDKSISFNGCMTQLYFFMSFGSTEYLLLTIMAYDRYVAICNPMHYTTMMSRKLCIYLAACAWTIGFMEAAPTTVLISNLDFCRSNEINHLFCDVTPLLALSCSSTYITEIVIFLEGVLIMFACFILNVISYIKIITSILKMSSHIGRSKAFSTCASHLTSVILFYVIILCLYMRPRSSYSLDQGKVLSVIYAGVIPMLNPIIYCLRNKEVKKALLNFSKV